MEEIDLAEPQTNDRKNRNPPDTGKTTSSPSLARMPDSIQVAGILLSRSGIATGRFTDNSYFLA